MDSKKILTNLSERFVLPILLLVVIGLSYLAFSANRQLRNTRVEFATLNAKFKTLKFSQMYVGTKMPDELFAIVSSKLKASNHSEIRYFVLQFISIQACTPCTEEDINIFRKISAASEKCMLFFVVSDTTHRELVTLKKFFGIDFPVHFVFYSPTTPNYFLDSAMLLTLTDGTILLRSTSTPTDSLLKNLNRRILLRFAQN